MVSTLSIGALTLPSRIIQGPLAGISCAPFRALAWQHGAPAFCYTEMISCKTILYAPAALRQRYVTRDPRERLLCYQLSGDNPQELARAAQHVTALGADLIDLNCGCPMKKIRRKGTGSRLLSDPSKLYALIAALKNSTHVPVLVKIRVDARSQDRFNAEVARAVTEAGADALVVHGRHWQEDYTLPCYYPDIAYFVAEMSIPVIGNGDVADLASCQRLLATGCAGVMLGRAGVGKPWLSLQLQQALAGRELQTPDALARGAMLLAHVQGLIHLLGHERRAIQEARQFAKYYARGLPNAPWFEQALCQTDDLATFTRLVDTCFSAVPQMSVVPE